VGASSCPCSRHFRRPTPLAVKILRPATASMGEVVAMGDQPLVQMAGQLRDAVGARMVPEEVAGHADLPATAGAKDRLIEPGPLLDRLLAGGLQTGKRDRHHGDSSMRTPVLAGVALWRQRVRLWRPGAAPGRSQSSRDGTGG